MLVLERPAGAQDLFGQRLAVLLRRREVVFIGDFLLPEDPEPLHLHLKRAAVLVGLPFDADVRRVRETLQQLVGEPPHQGVHRAGPVYQLHRKGAPRLSLRTAASVARKLERSLAPGVRSRTQSFSFFRGHPPKQLRIVARMLPLSAASGITAKSGDQG